MPTRAALLSIFLAAALLAVAIAYSTPARAYGEPIAITLLNNTQLNDMLVLNETTIYVTSPKNNTLYLVKLDPDVRIAGQIVSSIELPASPRKIMHLILGGKDYIAVLVGRNTLVIADTNLNKTWIRSLPGNVVEVIAIGDRIYALTNIRGVGNALAALIPGKLGWSEARVVIGNLLQNRLENFEPIQISAIKNYDKLLVLYSVSPLAYYKLILKLMVATKNGTIPAANATIYVYTVNQTLFLGIGSSDINGTAVAQLYYPPTRTLTLFVKYNGTCYTFSIKPSDIMALAERDQTFVVKKAIILNNAQVLPLCPTPPKTYQLGLLSLEDNGNISITLLNVNVNSPGNVNIIDAYRSRDGYLYIWIGGAVNSIGEAKYGGNGFAYLKVDLEKHDLVSEKFYAYPGSFKAIHVSDDYEIIVAGTQLFLATLGNNSYKLTWSIDLPKPLTSYSEHFIRSPKDDIILAAASPGRVYLINLSHGAAESLVYSAKLGIDVDGTINKLHLDGKAIYIAGAQGLIIVDNLNYLKEIHFDNIKQIHVHPISIRFIDSFNKTKVCGELEYSLIAVLAERNVTIASGTSSLCGTVNIPYGPGLTIVARFMPNSPLYRNVSLEITKPDNITVYVDRNLYRLTLFVRDNYTGDAPERPLLLSINATDINYSVEKRLPAGSGSITVTLPAGAYVVSLADGGLYLSVSRDVILDHDKILEVSLERIPVTVSIRITTTIPAEPPDVVNLTVISLNGSVLYVSSFNSPEPQRPILVTFTTKYRGEAIVEVGTAPGSGLFNSPFYKPVRVTINITDDGAEFTIALEPYLYILRVAAVAADDRSPVNASIEVYRGKTLVASARGAAAEFTLTRGRYIIRVYPLPHPVFNVTVFEPVNTTITVDTNKSITIALARVRFPTNIIVRDPYALGNTTADDIEILVDNVLFAKLKAGKPVKPVTVLVAKQGSKLVIRSVHGIYENYAETIKPSKEPIIAVINRKIYQATISVINDVGEGIGGAAIDIAGTNLVYTTRVNTNNNGQAMVPLPYGEYQVCVSASGYYPSCSKLSVVGDTELSIILKPRPLTLVLRYMPLIIAVIIAIVLVVVVRRYFRKMLERIGAEEEF